MMRRVVAMIVLAAVAGCALALGALSGFSCGYVRQHFRRIAPPVVRDSVAALKDRFEGGAAPVAGLPEGVWNVVDYTASGDSERVGVVVGGGDGGAGAWNLSLSAHGPSAELIDACGEVVHRWTVACEGDDPAWIRRAHVYENGDLLVLRDGGGVAKLDRDSNVLWTYRDPAGGPGCRFDFALAEDGRIRVLAGEERVVPRVHESNPVVEDFVVTVGPDGVEQGRVSVLECFERSDYESVLRRMGRWGDVLRVDGIAALDGVGGVPGDVLVSVWMLDTVAAIDLDAGRVVWALGGLWNRQQSVSLTEGTGLLLAETRHADGVYRMLEVLPRDHRVVWSLDVEAPGIALGHESAPVPAISERQHVVRGVRQWACLRVCAGRDGCVGVSESASRGTGRELRGAADGCDSGAGGGCGVLAFFRSRGWNRERSALEEAGSLGRYGVSRSVRCCFRRRSLVL